MRANSSPDEEREDSRHEEGMDVAAFAAGTGGLDDPGSVVSGPFGAPGGTAAALAMTGGLRPEELDPPSEEEVEKPPRHE